jgi:4-amino-4-deoxy-L-arabinose transferase-like glycosyltransferase
LFAMVALAGAAGLAIAAVWKSNFLLGPPRRLELPRFHPALYAACLPGAISLLLALLVHLRGPSGDPRAARLWIVGLVLLLLPGVADWYRTARRPGAAAKRESRRFAAAAVFLFAFAFAIRVWGGIDRIPGWLDSDEGATGLAGSTSFGEGTRALFGFWDMGNPNMALFVSQLAARPFGEGLRALRLGAALLGSLSVVLLFDFARRLVGSRTALLAALLLSVNHTFVHYSRVGQIYVETPFFTSLVLALLLRAMSGGSFLTLTAAGVALGIGAATYIPAQILPALVILTLTGWGIIMRWPSKRLLIILAFLGTVVALTCAPMVATVMRMPLEIVYQRIPAISVLRADGFRQLRDAYGADTVLAAVGEHVLRTISIFNFGSDHFKAYGANRALADAVTGALAPAAYALLLHRLSSPVGWVSIVFTGAYLSGAVLLCAGPPSYHRVLVVLLFSCLGVAWTMTGLARAFADRVNVPRWLPAAAAVAVVGASAWFNLHYYFREFPRARQTEAGFALGKLICRYAGTYTVVDATALDGHSYVPSDNLYPSFQCPEAKWVRVHEASRLWQFPELTDARRVALIVPNVVESANPGQPRGYRLVRRYVDRSIRQPVDLPLSVMEYERSSLDLTKGSP